MDKIRFKGNKDKESTGSGGGNYTPKVRGIYRLQICEIKKVGETGPDAKYPGLPMINFRCEIADDGPQQGAHVYHNLVFFPETYKGKEVKAHGITVHFLHAVGMEYDGDIEIDPEEFLEQDHCMFDALLDVQEYEKIGDDGKRYTNEKYVVEQVYSDSSPAPKELPAPRKAKAPVKEAVASGSGTKSKKELSQDW